MGNTSSGKQRRSSFDEGFSIDQANMNKRRSQNPQESGDQNSKWILGTKAYENLMNDVRDITLTDQAKMELLTVNSSFSPAQSLQYDLNNENKVPTLFKWDGGGKQVYIAGTFNQWKGKIPMVKSSKNFYTIVDLPVGEHQFKFIVDNHWKVDSKQKTVSCSSAKQPENVNNVIEVRASDAHVLETLSYMEQINSTGASTPPGEYTKTIPQTPGIALQMSACVPQLTPSEASSIAQKDAQTPQLPTDLKKLLTPPSLPPQLLQVILNKDISVQSDPNLLPQPNHVMVNHMYALSIRDGVMVLSAITRYRQKFVSTLLYRPT